MIKIAENNTKQSITDIENNIIKTHNYNELKKILTELTHEFDSLKMEITSIIRTDSNAIIEKKLKKFLSEFEMIFLKYKVLNLYLNTCYDKEIIESFVKIDPLFSGITNDFKADLIMENKDYLTYYLPFFIGNRCYDNGTYIGEFTGNIIQNLTLNSFKNIKKFKKIHKGMIVFEHHFDISNMKNNLVDPDNIEAKKALDALNGLVLEDDSIININIVHISKNDDQEYTKIHVIRNEYVSKWMMKNIDLFKK